MNNLIRRLQSPERPPLAPHDPPDPAPQAAAWRRAIQVVINSGACARGIGHDVKPTSAGHADRHLPA